ncbi:hypothetical protein AB0K43_10130 [Kitasatospora sp. NPDC049258]|uniref:hypothetical protein n=1 Tax=Kitasatospora sp. NPDC049258 TaxID=3155394 RepID=UPI00343E904F
MPDLDDGITADPLVVALRGLTADAPHALPLPYETVRAQGRRRRRARRVIMGTAAAVCMVAVAAGGVLLRPGSVPGAVAPAASAPVDAPSTAEPRRPVLVRAEQPTLTVPDGPQQRNLELSTGWPLTPSGGIPSMTVTALREEATMNSATGNVLDAGYAVVGDQPMHWCVRIDTSDDYRIWVCAKPALPTEALGRRNPTQAQVWLSEPDAIWFFHQVAVGDRIRLAP